jgi:hypothetical protein
LRESRTPYDYPKNLCRILSPNLIKLVISETVGLAEIDELTRQYPSLQEIDSFLIIPIDPTVIFAKK